MAKMILRTLVQKVCGGKTVFAYVKAVGATNSVEKRFRGRNGVADPPSPSPFELAVSVSGRP